MFWTVTLSILQGCGEAAKLFFLTLLFALPLGLVVAFGSMNKWAPFRFLLRGKSAPSGTLRALAAFRPISALTNLIVWVIRGTPLILQLIIIFYGPGMWFKANPWNAFSDGRMFACTLAFVINYACYFSVIYRGGIEGVPAGQREAGQVLGLTRSQIFFQVTLLQMVKRIVPPHVQRGHHPGEGHLPGPGHRHHGDHQGRRGLHEVRGHHLAPLLHGGLLPGLRGHPHHPLPLH